MNPDTEDALVEKVARAIDPGVWELIDSPRWFMPDNPNDIAMRDNSLRRAQAAITSVRSEERARIVAWLRKRGDHYEEVLYRPAAILHEAARALERSDHIAGGSST